MLNYRIFGGRRWYQHIEFSDQVSTRRFCGPKGVERTGSFLDWLGTSELLSPEDVVLDLGSNAGFLSVAMAEKVRRVVGIELDRGFYRQSKFVLSYLKNRSPNVDKVEVHRGDVTRNLHLLENVTVVLASKFLYHKNFSEEIHEFMSAVQSSAVRLFVVQGHTVQGDLGGDSGAAELLRQYGFSYREETSSSSEYPIGVAERFTKD